MAETITPIVALMCGSFNPVTRMHLQMLKIVKQYIFERQNPKSSLVRAIISPVNDLYAVKRKNLLQSNHRIAMVNLSLKEDNLTDWVECDTWESEQKEWQTTINVLNYHSSRMKLKFGPTTQVWMVSGADLIESMTIPGLWANEDLQNICGNYTLFILPRIGSDAKKVISSHSVLSQHLDKLVIADYVLPNDDSSTKVRASIKEGLDPTDLTYPSVINYIKQNNFYKD